MVRNPRGRLHVVVGLFAVITADGFVGIGATVKDEDAAAGGHARGADQVERIKRTAVAFVAAAPFFRPPVDLLHRVSEEGLFSGEEVFGDGVWDVGEECVADVTRLAGLESEHGGVADAGGGRKRVLCAGTQLWMMQFWPG